MPKGLPASLQHERRDTWRCPQCPQCPPGHCCHLLAGPNPAPVLSLATVPRLGDPSVTPLCCAPLLGTQGSVTPCMAPGSWAQHHPVGAGRYWDRIRPVASSRVGAAALLGPVSPGNIQFHVSRAAEDAHPEIPSSRLSPISWVSLDCGDPLSPVLLVAGVCVPSLFPRPLLPSPAFPEFPLPLGPAGDNWWGPGPRWVWGHPGPPCTSLSTSHRH